MGAERSRLVKRLADDRKIRGISLLTGCCMCTFFFLLSFFLLQMFFVSLFQSSCLGSNWCARTHTRTSTQNHTHANTRASFLCSHRRQI